MKQLQQLSKAFLALLILFCMTASTSLLQAQTVVYRIQIGAFGNPNMNDFASLKSLGKVFVEEGNNGVKRVMMGDFKERTTAKNALAKVRNIGYEDAFMVRAEVIAPETLKVPRNNPTEGEPTDVYMVQLGAYSNIDYSDFVGVTDLGDIYLDTSGKVTKVLVGPFFKEHAARMALTKIKTRGYKDAFLRQQKGMVVKKN